MVHRDDRFCHGSGHEYSIDFLVQNDKDNTGAFFAFIDNITNTHISGTNRPANTLFGRSRYSMTVCFGRVVVADQLSRSDFNA